MRQHPLRNLLISQFFGAFNDNAWKLTITFIAIRVLGAKFQGSSFELEKASQFQTTITFSVLTIPLILFSLPAGYLADRFSKRTVLVWMKLLEAVLMMTGMIVLYFDPYNVTLLLMVLGCLGAQAAIFSPSKYGILPEILPHTELSKGNALLEMWTFLAIILGTSCAGFLIDKSGGSFWKVGGLLTFFSMCGFIASLGIPKVPAQGTKEKLWSVFHRAWKTISSIRVLGLAIVGSVFYWLIASLLGQDILVYSKNVLHLNDTYASLPLGIFGLGVGGGCLLAAKLSNTKVEYGLIPLGTIGMALSCGLLGALPPHFALLLLFMFSLGMASGLFIVPIHALIQWHAPPDQRGAVISLCNIFTFTGIFVGSLTTSLFSKLGCSSIDIILLASAFLIVGTIYAVYLLPDALLRLGLILLTNTFYRLKVIDAKNVPEKGGVLLVPNHVSFVDALLILASVDRPVRFIAEQSYFENVLLKPFMKSMGVIPISDKGGPRMILRALRDAGESLDQGEMVCIFPEGQITRTGTLLPFRRGLERIVKNRNAVVVPVYLDRMWGSIFSRERGRFLTKTPKEIPYRVTVAFGNPLDAKTPLYQIRQAVCELNSTAWEDRKKDVRPLHETFVKRARGHPFRLAFADLEQTISRVKALSGSIALARAFKPFWKDQKIVGLMLPTSVPGALANLAATISGRVTVNLNYTTGQAALDSAIAQADVKTLLTSRRFMEKLEIQLPKKVQILWIEDITEKISGLEKILATLAAFLFPVRLLEKFCGAKQKPTPNDLVTVIFSSGSTGDPKGVMLTHFNLESNVEALAQVFRVDTKDRVLGILPFFHSFGYMTLWFAAKQGLAMPFHPNPLDAPAIGTLVHKYAVTILIATPTFLQLYMRRCTPAQFGSLRLVLTGAEKLPDRIANAFEDTFGIRPMEGYGTTECSPTIAASVPDFRARGFFQPGSRRGFVGQPIPGVSVRVIDPDSLTALAPNQPGMLWIKGPNVMKGYLSREDLTQKAFHDGWYVTGDIALVSEDGFLKITDRLSRFSKIGGEMIPHGKIEDTLHQAANSDIQLFAVTAVADERKGESLVVIHTYDENKISELLEKLASLGLPNLYVPRRDHFSRVEKLPLLGTGKINLKEVKRLAEQAFLKVR